MTGLNGLFNAAACYLRQRALLKLPSGLKRPLEIQGLRPAPCCSQLVCLSSYSISLLPFTTISLPTNHIISSCARSSQHLMWIVAPGIAGSRTSEQPLILCLNLPPSGWASALRQASHPPAQIRTKREKSRRPTRSLALVISHQRHLHRHRDHHIIFSRLLSGRATSRL